MSQKTGKLCGTGNWLSVQARRAARWRLVAQRHGIDAPQETLIRIRT
jgi:hypothetical protein